MITYGTNLWGQFMGPGQTLLHGMDDNAIFFLWQEPYL